MPEKPIFPHAGYPAAMEHPDAFRAGMREKYPPCTGKFPFYHCITLIKNLHTCCYNNKKV
jgi:hypothetical protein